MSWTEEKGDVVLVFGGSFDPPHVGHMALLKNAVAAVRPQRVLVVPSGTAPHKRGSETPGDVRAEMCACFAPVFPQLVVSRIELDRAGKSYTVQTLELLKEQMPKCRFALCIGGDMLRSFESWYRWEDILALAALVVDGREEAQRDAEVAKRLRAAGGTVLFAPGDVPQVASSELRRAVCEGRNLAGLVPPPADEIITRRGLYRTGCADS